jgi:hypothetical protein
MTLMPAFDPYAAARLPLTISQEDLAKAARNRPKEGDTKPARGKKGGTLTFTKGRWRRGGSPSGASGNLRPKAQPAQQLNVISDDAPAPKVKKGGKSRKGKEWGADTSNLRPKPKSPVEQSAQMRMTRWDQSKEKTPAGGGLVPKGGGLSTVPKPKAEEGRGAVGGQESIDQKYASENPSEADIDGWLQESAVEYTRPDPTRVEADTLVEMKKRFGVDELFTADPKLQKKHSKIRDKKSLAAAVYEKRQAYLKGIGGTFEPYHFGLDFEKTEYAPALRTAEKRMTSGKTEQSRAKAKAQYEKLMAKKEEYERDGPATAARQNAIYSAPKKEQIQQIMQTFDDKVAETLDAKAQQHAQVKQGNKRAMQDAMEGMVKHLDTFNLDGIDYNSFKNKQKRTQHYRNVVRAHLTQSHQKGGGDASVLGLQGKPQSAQELKTAYRQAAQSAHPDRGGSREAFDKVRGAYERLVDQHFPDLKKALFTLAGVAYAPEEHPTHGIVFRKVALV